MEISREEYRKSVETLDAILMPLMQFFKEDVQKDIQNSMRVLRSGLHDNSNINGQTVADDRWRDDHYEMCGNCRWNDRFHCVSMQSEHYGERIHSNSGCDKWLLERSLTIKT